MVDLTEEAAASRSRYNAKTELSVDLTGGDNTKDWSVESKPHPGGGR